MSGKGPFIIITKWNINSKIVTWGIITSAKIPILIYGLDNTQTFSIKQTQDTILFWYDGTQAKHFKMKNKS